MFLWQFADCKHDSVLLFFVLQYSGDTNVKINLKWCEKLFLLMKILRVYEKNSVQVEIETENNRICKICEIVNI